MVLQYDKFVINKPGNINKIITTWMYINAFVYIQVQELEPFNVSIYMFKHL
jgi:hypothetical protein